MISKSLVVVVLSLSAALFLAPVVASYVPHVGDYFSYYEVWNLGNGTGPTYSGYTEQMTVNGTEMMNAVSPDGNVSAYYNYSSNWSNNQGQSSPVSMSGNFTFSSVSFLYVNGTDNQTGPYVWFLMDNSLPEGNTFYLLDTGMTVISNNYSFYLPSQNRNVNTIYAQGSSNYQRDDSYGQFAATYTWDAYFDPATGFIVGYNYVESDTNSTSGDGFTITENLYVTSTSYSLTTAAPSNPGVTLDLTPYLGYIVAIVLIIVVVIIIYAFSKRRKTLPEHPSQHEVPTPGPPPPEIDLTPKQQPAVQQIVIKEVVKVKCLYCGALIDSTAEKCPYCGAPRT